MTRVPARKVHDCSLLNLLLKQLMNNHQMDKGSYNVTVFFLVNFITIVVAHTGASRDQLLS